MSASSDSSDSPAGFALRTSESCLKSEEDCGITVRPYRVCCPGSTFCPSAYNPDCCPTPENCTSAILEKPRCANSSWDLYDNNGYFCCLKGLRGYSTTRNTNGCAGPGHSFNSGETLLELISAGQDPSSSTTSSSAESTSTSSTRESSSTESKAESTTTSGQNPSPTSELSESGSQSGSSSNAGAIAGGVVGGIVGLALIAALIWLLLKKRRKQDVSNGAAPKSAEQLPSSHPVYEAPGGHNQIHEAPGRQVYEAPTRQVYEAPTRQVYEVPG